MNQNSMYRYWGGGWGAVCALFKKNGKFLAAATDPKTSGFHLLKLMKYPG